MLARSDLIPATNIDPIRTIYRYTLAFGTALVFCHKTEILTNPGGRTLII